MVASMPLAATTEALFAALTDRSPGEVVLHGAEHGWCVGELLEAVEQLAAVLVGVRVLAVLADNSPQWIAADLAALRGGVAHLPLPAFFTSAQVAHALEQVAADCVLTDQPERIVALDVGFATTGTWRGLVCLQRKVAARELPALTAKISFTSGSSGAPKGVCLSAAGLLGTAQAVAARLAGVPVARHLAVLPLALLLENTAGVYAPLLRGAQVCLPGLGSLGWRGMAGFDAAALRHEVARWQVNSVILVPELLKAWTTLLEATGDFAPPQLHYAAVGGARVAPALLAQARARGLPAYQGYGLTECGSVVSLNHPGDDGDGVGRPLAHVGVRIEAGEVRVAGNAFLGYVGAAPSDRKRADDFATGDLGHFDATGRLHLSGRRSNVLITSYGRNIAPEWVESVLLAQPEIGQALVCGDGLPAPVALLVPATSGDGGALAAAVARANRSLPDYARVRRWLVVPAFTAGNGLATGNGRPIRQSILTHHAAVLAAIPIDKEAIHVASDTIL